MQATTFQGAIDTTEWEPRHAAPEMAAHRATYLAKLTERTLSPRDLRELIVVGRRP